MSVEDGEISVTADLITDSLARGLFIVFQSDDDDDDGSPDEFRAVLREGEEDSVSSTIPAPPPSTYSVLVYDLENDGLPNTHPALHLYDPVIVRIGI